MNKRKLKMANINNQNCSKTILISSDVLLQNLNRLRDYDVNKESLINAEINKAISNEHGLDTINTSCVKLENEEDSLISDINIEDDIKMLEVKAECENISVIADSNVDDSLIIPTMEIKQEYSPGPAELNENNLLATRVKIEYEEMISDVEEDDLIAALGVKVEREERSMTSDVEQEILLPTSEVKLEREVDFTNAYLLSAPAVNTGSGGISNYSISDTSALSEIKNENELNLMVTDENDDMGLNELDEQNMSPKTNASLSGQPRKSTLTSTSSFLKECVPYLDENCLDYLKCLFSLEQHSKKSYSLSYKKLCLSLYYNSPWAYTFLGESFSLMNLSEINSMRIPITSNCNQFVLELIKTKIPIMTTQERMFAVYIQTIPLCENISYDDKNDHIVGFQEINNVLKPIVGKNAVIAMIHGIHTNAKYIVSNVVVGSTNDNQSLICWIEGIIKNLLDIGLDIRALISDFGPLTKDIATCLGINDKTTKFIVNDKSIHYIFSVSSLLMDARDHFMISDFYFDNGKIARWEHVKQFHKQNILNKASHLHDIFLNPSAEQRMISKNAIAIFNAHLAAALRSSISDASDTSDLLEQFSRMFEMLKFAQFKEDCIYVCGDLYQKEVLFTEIVMFLDSLKMVSTGDSNLLFKNIDEAKDFTFVDGFKVTVESVKNLHADLESEGCNTLAMWSVNQGFSDDFLKDLHNDKYLVTAQDLINFLGEMNLKYIIQNSDNNFGYDLSESLSRITTFMQKDSLEENLSNHVFVLTNISKSDYQLTIPPVGALSFVALQVFQVCLRIHSHCKKLRGYMSEIEIGSYHGNFVALITEMDKVFVKVFNATTTTLPKNIGVSLLKAIDQLHLNLPCDCFPYLYMKAIFVRIRLHHLNSVILKCEGQSNQVYLKINHLEN